jgi:hypothetical protein
MAHALRLGTAWDRTREEYAHARELDEPGWAWEFLRRNEAFRRDVRLNRAGTPVAIQHVSGALLYRPSRRFVSAEAWGLALFADPDKTALETDIFWLPHLLRHAVTCHCKPSNDNASDVLSLASFVGRRAVLASLTHEVVTICSAGHSANLIVTDGSLLFGNSSVTFQHEGLTTASRHYETVTILRKLSRGVANSDAQKSAADNKYLDYLIALDGHLEGRSYRDIAVVLYGKERVGSHWTDDTRWMKSKVRRAVDRGITLMNSGYRNLL